VRNPLVWEVRLH